MCAKRTHSSLTQEEGGLQSFDIGVGEIETPPHGVHSRGNNEHPVRSNLKTQPVACFRIHATVQQCTIGSHTSVSTHNLATSGHQDRKTFSTAELQRSSGSRSCMTHENVQNSPHSLICHAEQRNRLPEEVEIQTFKSTQLCDGWSKPGQPQVF